jgi:endonuclease YncB( thermonuclease family)
VIVYGSKQDRYGRTITLVNLQNGLSVNRELVKQGLVWNYTQYSKSEQLSQLKELARKHKRRLWHDENAVPPGQFRKLCQHETCSRDSMNR